MNKIDGKTLTCGIIGDPVDKSLSPKIHAYFAEHFDINMAYMPFGVKAANLQEAVRGAHALGIRGLNVTVPHKQTIMPYLAAISPEAARVGAVNTLVWQEDGYSGHNTDYLGIKYVLRQHILPSDKVLIVGAGGSAYAASVAAAEEGAKQIAILNRTAKNAHALAQHVNKHYNVNILVLESQKPWEYSPDIIIQTTIVGTGTLAEKSPVKPEIFEGAKLAFDILYAPWETEFLRQAKQAGVAAVNGFPMLVSQAAAAFAKWFGLVEFDGHEHMQTLRDVCM